MFCRLDIVNDTGLGEQEYDVYICYYGENIRTSFVEPVYHQLSKLGVHAFYDLESVAWGESITNTLQTALLKCRRVLLVVSKSLIDERRCLIECKALLHNQREGTTQLIYPILVNIDRDTFCSAFPLLADVQPRTAMGTAESINELCFYLKEVCSKPLYIAKRSMPLSIAPVKENGTMGNGRIPQFEKQYSVGNLRQLVPHFTGRNTLVNEVVDYIVSSLGCTICELGGTPGVGKSMVAIAVARELQSLQWRIVYADLRDVKSSAIAAEKLLQEGLLDDRNVGSKLLGLANALKKLAKRSPLLVVLDGCDGLLESNWLQAPTSLVHHHASSLHNLLDSMSQHNCDLKALFTSSHRVVPFDISFKYFQVPPLSIDDAAEYLTKCCIDANVQEKLLQKWLKKLAEQCGGFPIALNFVSSIICTRNLSPKSVVNFLSTEGVYKLRQVSSRLPFEHYNCFSAAFYHLQSDTLRSHLACLTVFVGSFNCAAASAVLQLSSIVVQRDVIHPLVERCLIENNGNGGQYFMHSVVWEYIYELVREQHHSDISEASALFTNYYIKKLKEAVELFWKDPSTALEMLDSEWHNFEVAISFKDGFHPSCISDQLIPIVVDALPLLETRLSGSMLLNLLQSYSNFDCCQTVRARLLLETAKKLIEQSNVDRALSIIAGVKELLPYHNIEEKEISMLVACYNAIMGDALLAQNKPVEAVFFLSKSWKLYESICCQGYQAVGVLTVLGRSYADLGHMDKAMEYYRKATHMCSLQLGGHDKDGLLGGLQRGIHPYKVVILKQMGETESSRGNQQMALKCMDKAIKILSQLRACDLLLAPILYEKGVTQLLNNQYTEAIHTIETSFDQTKQLNRYSMLHFFTAFILGKLKYNIGDFELAIKCLDEAVKTAAHNGYTGDAFVEALAFLAISQKQVGKATHSSITYDKFSDALQKCGSQCCMQNPAIKALVNSSPQFVTSANSLSDDFDPPRAMFCCCRYSDFTRHHHVPQAVLNSPLCLAAGKRRFGHQLHRSPSFHIDTPVNNGTCTPDISDLLHRRNSVTNVGRTPTSVEAVFRSTLSVDVEPPRSKLSGKQLTRNFAVKSDNDAAEGYCTKGPPPHVQRFLSWTSQGSTVSYGSDSDDGNEQRMYRTDSQEYDFVHHSPIPKLRHSHRKLSAEGRHRLLQMSNFRAASHDVEPTGHSIPEDDTIDGNESTKKLVFVEDHFT